MSLSIYWSINIANASELIWTSCCPIGASVGIYLTKCRWRLRVRIISTSFSQETLRESLSEREEIRPQLNNLIREFEFLKKKYVDLDF